MRRLAAALALIAVTAPAGAAGAADWARFEAHGRIASLRLTSGALVLIPDDERAARIEVRIVPGASVVEAGGQLRTDLAGLLPGEAVAVWGAEDPAGGAVAIRVVATTRRRAPAAVQAAPAGGPFRGVVTAARGSVLTVVTDGGAVRQVVLSASTRLRGGDSVGRYDVVQVEGGANSDGSVVASVVAIVFGAARGGRVAGRAIGPAAGAGFFLGAATFVNVTPGTLIVDARGRRPFDAITWGHPVSAYGDPITYRGTLLGLTARVVVIE